MTIGQRIAKRQGAFVLGLALLACGLLAISGLYGIAVAQDSETPSETIEAEDEEFSSPVVEKTDTKEFSVFDWLFDDEDEDETADDPGAEAGATDEAGVDGEQGQPVTIPVAPSPDAAAEDEDDPGSLIPDKNPTRRFSIFGFGGDDDGDADETPPAPEKPGLEASPAPAPDPLPGPEPTPSLDTKIEVRELAAPAPVTVPPVTAPSVTAPSVTAPSVTAPSVTDPAVAAPAVAAPAAPPVTAQPVTAPLPPSGGDGDGGAPATAGQEPTEPVPTPLALPLPPAAPAPEQPESETETLGDALRELMTQNPVVALVEGQEIRWADVINSAEGLDLKKETQVEALFPALLDRMIDLTLLGAAARRQGLAADPEVHAQVRAYEDELVRERFVARELARRVTEVEIRARYAKLVETIGTRPQLRARHILVETADEAAGLIAELESGGVFADLAKAHSRGPSATRGGDLGYFDPGRMVPEFSGAALALEPGQFTRTPVKSPFGWHVIELLDKRYSGVPPYHEMREALWEQMTQEAMDLVLSDLRARSAIEVFPNSANAVGPVPQ